MIFSFSSSYCVDLISSNSLKLKKDQEQKIIVKYDGKEKIFTFRWTLYKNNGLVILRSYDKNPAQNILYLRETNKSFRVELKSRGVNFYDKPYLLVMFKDFNFDTREATFELLLSDDSKKIKLIYEEKK